MQPDNTVLHIPNMGITLPNMGISTRRSGGRAARQKSAAAPEGTSLADALFTVTQQRVLALFFGQPDRSFFATEVIGLANVGSGAVQREFKRLVDSGLVTVSRVGSQKHYQANQTSPVFDELRGLVNKNVALHAPIRDALKPFEDRIVLAAPTVRLQNARIRRRATSICSSCRTSLLSSSYTQRWWSPRNSWLGESILRYIRRRNSTSAGKEAAAF